MKRLTIAAIFLIVSFAFGNLSITFAEEEKWTGVDESVVQKIAKEHGREAHKPLINTDQGDLLLFVFLLAGASGGFLAGYSWKNLMEKKTGCEDKQDEKQQSHAP